MFILERAKLDHSLVFGNELTPVIDLGLHSFADWFIPENLLLTSEPVMPLVLCLDPKSGLIHTQILTDPMNRYNGVDYSYTSSNSESSRTHWQEYARFVRETSSSDANRAYEIGSNDGYLCSQLTANGFQTIGIDASETMVDFANEQGIMSINALLTPESAKEISSEFGKAHIVAANNVLNHANNPLSFLQAMTNLIGEKGLLYIEVPYWKYQFETDNFDMIYHEHVSYFTLTSLSNILSKIELKIVDFKFVDYHGQSIRLVIGSEYHFTESKKLSQQIQIETSCGLFNPDNYLKYNERLKENRRAFLQKLLNAISENSSSELVGVGAAAKGNTFLNFYGFNSTNMLGVTDSSPRKIGKYTPLSRLRIFPDEIISDLREPLLIQLSWNLGEGLRNKLKSINPGVRFVS